MSLCLLQYSHSTGIYYRLPMQFVNISIKCYQRKFDICPFNNTSLSSKLYSLDIYPGKEIRRCLSGLKDVSMYYFFVGFQFEMKIDISCRWMMVLNMWNIRAQKL